MSSYKSAKEAFVSDTTGSSVSHVNAISLVALVSLEHLQIERRFDKCAKATILLHSAVETRLKDSGGRRSFKPGAGIFPFFSEFGLLVFPLLLSMTLFATRPLLLVLIIAFPAVLLIVLRPSHLSKSALLPTPTSQSGHAPSQRSSPSPTPTPNASLETLTQNHTRSMSIVETVDRLSGPASVEPAGKFETQMSFGPVPYLTIYRSHMILMTTIAILAVDFPVFPRRLAKCESFGVSLVCAPLFTCSIVPKITSKIRRWTLASDHLYFPRELLQLTP